MAGAANATTLTATQGDVLVNQGQGFKTVAGDVVLKTGDAVMVGKGGGAKIAFADGCVVPVQNGSVTAIGAKSPCALRADMPKPYYSGVYDPQDAKEAPPSSAAASVVDPGLVALGAVAAVGIGAVIIARKNNRSPASP